MISYHGQPLSGGEKIITQVMQGRDAMVSWASHSSLPVLSEVCRSVVIDNGAFSFWKSEKRPNWSRYYSFCEKWLKHPAVQWCVIPDVIDGTEKENNELVYSWPHKHGTGVPVWHMHESIDRLILLCGGFPLVALGSSGEYANVGSPAWWSRIAEAMEAITDDDGLPTAKLHGLRMLDPTILAHLPLSSADSTNVARNIGLDVRWSGPYSPKSLAMRALIIMDRIEHHATAHRWVGTSGIQKNFELLDCREAYDD